MTDPSFTGTFTIDVNGAGTSALYPSPDLYPGTDLFPGGAPLPADMPSVDELGSRLYSRTRDKNDQYVGTFTDATTPNATEAAVLIADAYSMVSAQLGVTVPTAVQDIKKYAVIARAAMAVERQFYTNDAADDGAVQQWLAEYTAAIAAATTAMTSDQPNQSRIGMLSVRPRAREHRPVQQWSSFGTWPA
jgi:hypothetical protein